MVFDCKSRKDDGPGHYSSSELCTCSQEESFCKEMYGVEGVEVSKMGAKLGNEDQEQ